MATEADWESRITIDPKIQGGKPVIKGTRVPLQVIIGGLAGGMTVADICREFLITEDDVWQRWHTPLRRSRRRSSTRFLVDENVLNVSDRHPRRTSDRSC